MFQTQLIVRNANQLYCNFVLLSKQSAKTIHFTFLNVEWYLILTLKSETKPSMPRFLNNSTTSKLLMNRLLEDKTKARHFNNNKMLTSIVLALVDLRIEIVRNLKSIVPTSRHEARSTIDRYIVVQCYC
jgi:hypothetical protein